MCTYCACENRCLTTTSPMVMQAYYWLLDIVIQPLNYVVVSIHRYKDPAYIPYNSALDIVNNQSKFDVTIEPNQTTHHDVLPPEIVDPVVTELMLIDKYIQNVSIDFNHSLVGKTIMAGHHVTDDIPYGDVVLQNGADIDITASESIVIKEGVKVNKGALLRLFIDPAYSSSCGRSMLTTPDNWDSDPITEEFKQSYSNGKFKIISRSQPSDLIRNVAFNIYPNPCRSTFQIVSTCGEIQHIKLTNVFGETIVNNMDVNKNSKQIDVSSYTTGIYFVFIKTNQCEFVRKIMVQ